VASASSDKKETAFLTSPLRFEILSSVEGTMEAVEELEQLAGLLECPACDKLLHEPVVYGVCLHVFCRACSKASLGLLSVYPMRQEVTNGANVVPVPLIAKLVEVFKDTKAST
jgi:hypothetical protein